MCSTRDLIAPSKTADFLLLECRERGDVLANLKLQKLLYYSQAWHLALHGRPLFDEDFQAWAHGPVLPSQYHRFQTFGWRPITEDLQRPAVGADLNRHLTEIIEVFGAQTAVALELMTHRDRPWLEARGAIPMDQPSQAVIAKAAMRDFYRALQGSGALN